MINKAKNNKNFLIVFILGCVLISLACQEKPIEDHELGFIDADVQSEDTLFASQSLYKDDMPGSSTMIPRSFENAPPLIPHTTIGFFPIKKDRNVCLSCHLPEEALKVKAKSIPKTHMSNIRPSLILVNGIYQSPPEKITITESRNLNNAYFHCSQCHTPQTTVSINIENRFSPEFRKQISQEKSDLINKINEGIRK